MYMPNAAAALISMRYGAKGPNYCTVSACASSAHSVGDALELIRHDQADIMIAGGAEAAITPLAVASFANMKALSERNDSPQTASRPFDKDRDGFVMGDGAGVLILEEWEHARRRGAKIYAEVVGFGQTADAHHITAPAPDGSGAQEAMRLAMRDGGIEPSQVGYINAHGTSTPHGDAAETAAVKAVFGDRAKKLIFGSTKSMTGHLLGAAGAFEAGVCALVVQTGIIPPTINQFTPDPACDLDSAPNKAVKRHVDVALECLGVRRAHRAARHPAGGVMDGRSALAPIADKVERGERLTRDAALALFHSHDLLTIGRLADQVNRRRNGDRVCFAANQHINPTNVCVLRNTCVFCSFARMPQEEGDRKSTRLNSSHGYISYAVFCLKKK